MTHNILVNYKMQKCTPHKNMLPKESVWDKIQKVGKFIIDIFKVGGVIFEILKHLHYEAV